MGSENVERIPPTCGAVEVCCPRGAWSTRARISTSSRCVCVCDGVWHVYEVVPLEHCLGVEGLKGEVSGLWKTQGQRAIENERERQRA